MLRAYIDCRSLELQLIIVAGPLSSGLDFFSEQAGKAPRPAELEAEGFHMGRTGFRDEGLWLRTYDDWWIRAEVH